MKARYLISGLTRECQLYTRITVVMTTLMLSISPAQAEGLFDEVRYVAGASIGYSTFSFPEKLDHTIGFPSTNLTLAATARQWQVSFNTGTSLIDSDISEEEDVGRASRNDADLTIGYQLASAYTLFGGYKSGKTKLAYISRQSLDDDLPVSQPESYSQEGAFVGISYSWRFEKAGVINLSLAYADMTAVNKFIANTDEPEDSTEAVEFDDLAGRVEGDLTGFSYALTWTMPVASNLLFQTKFKINDYQQNVRFAGQRFNNVDVKFNSLHVGLAYVF
jgi:hypothetical protein